MCMSAFYPHRNAERGAVAAAMAVSFTRLGNDTLEAWLPALLAVTGIGSGLDITHVRWTHGGCFLGRSGRAPLAWPRAVCSGHFEVPPGCRELAGREHGKEPLLSASEERCLICFMSPEHDNTQREKRSTAHLTLPRLKVDGLRVL